MVEFYTMDIGKLTDPMNDPQVLENLGEQRKEKILKCKRELSRKQSFGAGLLLKQCFDKYSIDMDSIRYNEKGKPEVDGFFFNLSHSADYVVLAVSDKPVGCDIEKIKSAREGIARRYFSDKENLYLESFQGDSRIQEFYRIWTIKESYVKMTGEGISFTKSFPEVRFEEKIYIYRDGKRLSCSIEEYEIDGYKCSVCSLE